MVALYSPRAQLICPCCRRTLADAEKASYITAVKCMQSLPALRDHGEAVRTRFDEFQALHIEVADRVHATVSLCWRTIAVRESKGIYLGSIPSLASTFLENVRGRTAVRVWLRWSNTVRLAVADEGYWHFDPLVFCRYWDWTQDADESKPYVLYSKNFRAYTYVFIKDYLRHLSSIQQLVLVEVAFLAPTLSRQIRMVLPSFTDRKRHV